MKADLGLHLAIAAAADNPFLVSISTLIEVALVAMMTTSSPVDSPRRFAMSVAEHGRLVDAIADRDPDAARTAMQAVVHTGIAHSRD